MKKMILPAVVIAMFVLSNSAFAGSLTLHPSGFGPHSYSSWKAQQGLPDDTGNANQALYFQKMTATTTIAAGIANIQGLAGMPLSALTGLQFTHRTDGHCGAGAPRWNIYVKNALGVRHTIFLGCYAAQHSASPATDPGGHAWCVDRFPASALGNTTGLTITGLQIAFDEGTDNALPQPPGCPAGTSTPGFVYLDNITVDVNGVPHVWTASADNGNT